MPHTNDTIREWVEKWDKKFMGERLRDKRELIGTKVIDIVNLEDVNYFILTKSTKMYVYCPDTGYYIEWYLANYLTMGFALETKINEPNLQVKVDVPVIQPRDIAHGHF